MQLVRSGRDEWEGDGCGGWGGGAFGPLYFVLPIDKSVIRWLFQELIDPIDRSVDECLVRCSDDRSKDEWLVGCTDESLQRSVDEWLVGCTDESADRAVDEWLVGCTGELVNR